MTQAEVAKQPVVSVENLHVRFVMRDATVAAVNGVSFTLEAGQVLGILGESGSGKSVTLRALMRLLPPAHTRIEGRIRVDPAFVRPHEETPSIGDPTRARTVLGWEPRTSVDDLIAEMVAQDFAELRAGQAP